MSSTAPVLRVVGLTKVFANGAGVHDVSFDIADHAVTAVIGPNGSGKTVIFSLLTGLLAPDSGRVEHVPDVRVAYCPDVSMFEHWLTADEVVAASVALADPPAPLAVGDALDACGLAKVRSRRVAEFSRGMLQRLGIAAALVLDPDVLVLDEPSSALDPIGRADVRALIGDQRRERSVVLSSHSMHEVEQVADHVVVVADGRVVDAGTTAAILSRGLTPTWNVRLADGATADLAALSRAVPEAAIEAAGDGLLLVTFPSFEAAEDLSAGLRALVAAVDVPVLEVTLRDRDLDAAFARIVLGRDR